MVLTRAQRAQANGDDTAPGPDMTASVLKAPARRGRAKKTEAEPEKADRTAPKTSASKAPAPRAATAKAAAPKATALKSSTSNTVSTRATGSTRATTAKATTTKVTESKPVAKKQPVPAKQESRTTRKPAIPSRRVKKVEEPAAEARVQIQSPTPPPAATATTTTTEMEESRDTVMEDVHEDRPTIDIPQAKEENMGTSVQDEDSNAPPPSVLKSTSKLPRPLLPSQPSSPVKSFSLLSPNKALGSLRKPAVAGTLFSSPVKTFTLSSTNPTMEIGSPIRATPVTFEYPTGLSASPKRPMATIEEASSQTSSPKRLKTAASVPMLMMGSPLRPSSSSTTSSGTASSMSPFKSSLRSPVKKLGVSPKKSVTFRHPDPPTLAPVGVVDTVQRPPGILDGLVFYLDLVNQQGADSNYLFAPLIEEMGGECVVQWTSSALPVTHVVFMNGDVRTLEKVVASNGEVYCVNISWLLE
jgi:hypothetical protein